MKPTYEPQVADGLRILRLVPPHAIVEPDSTTAKDIQRATYRQIYLTPTQPFHTLQIVDVPAASSIRDGKGAPVCQLFH